MSEQEGPRQEREEKSRPLFSVSQFTTWHLSLEEDLELFTSLGIEGIEITERKLAADPGKAREQLAMVADAGIQVTSVQPRVHALFQDGMCPDLKVPEERMEMFRKTIDLFGEAFPDQELPLVTISGRAPGLNFRQAHETARRLYPDLASYAADRGIRIMFEPLNPILMNEDSFICSLQEALELMEDVDRANFGLMLDVWHIWREPAICERIAEIGERLFGVHVCDWPAGEPRHVGDRVLPGDGVIDLPALLGAVERSGYRDAYCMEIFSVDELPDSLWRQDPSEILMRGMSGFRKAWDARK
jgi:sugar phosphate isomerase/epimerase